MGAGRGAADPARVEVDGETVARLRVEVLVHEAGLTHFYHVHPADYIVLRRALRDVGD